MVTLTSEGENFPKKQVLLSGAWPQEMGLMACRKWPYLMVQNEIYEIISTFMNNKDRPVEQDTVSTFLALYDEDKFTDWLSEVGTKLLNESIDKDWIETTDFIQKLRTRFECQVQAIMTFPPDGLAPFVIMDAPSFGKVLHIVFIVGKP